MSAVPWLKNTLNIAGSHYHEDHHPAAFTAREMAHREHVSGHQVAKTVAVEADRKVLLLTLAASHHVSLNRVQALTGAHSVRMLSEAEIAFHFPDCEVGAIPPMRHWPDIDLWMDRSLKGQTEIVFHGGTLSDTIRMSFAEWLEIARPREMLFSRQSGSCPPDEEEKMWRDTQAQIQDFDIGQSD